MKNATLILDHIGELAAQRDEYQQKFEITQRLADEQFQMIANAISGEPEVQPGKSLAQMTVDVINRLRRELAAERGNAEETTKDLQVPTGQYSCAHASFRPNLARTNGEGE
jgi:hypothetical protein